LFLCLFFLSGTVSATNTIYVNGTGGNDNNNGTSWNHAKATIQNGTDTVSNRGTVYVANGIYKENLKINSSLSLYGESRSDTIIDGTNSGSVISIAPISSIFVDISNFTIINGDHTSYGGGISNPRSYCTITNCNIFSNTALADGGGIYNAGSCNIINSIITGNTARRDGGGIWNTGICYLFSSIIISNTALDLGGGVYNFGLLYADGSSVVYGNNPDQIFGNEIQSISSSILNPPVNNNSSSSEISLNSKNPLVNAESQTTIKMQTTGLPLAGLIIAILALFGGLASSKRK
jgi:hypothetical protein